MAVTTGRDQGHAVWRRVSPAAGQVLDLLHARMAEPYAPHLHGEFSIGVCTDGVEVIRYRGGLHYATPGSVVILEPDEPHTGGPAGPGYFTYRVMYPHAELLSERSGRVPWFPDPVVVDPGLAAGMRRVHAALCRGIEPLEAETRLSWVLGELVRRHAAPPTQIPAGWPDRAADGAVGREGDSAGDRAGDRVARLVTARLADELLRPPALAELAAQAGLSRYQLLRSFRAEVGMPPYAWLAQHRVARARVLLERGCRPAEVAVQTGFADQAHLTRWFRRVVGVTPGAYRNSVQDTGPRAAGR
jgi:AraC-like DNA-binding protein